MEYKSGIASRSRRKGRKSTWIRTVLLLFTAAGLAALLCYPEKVRAIAEGWIRIKNTFSYTYFQSIGRADCNFCVSSCPSAF